MTRKQHLFIDIAGQVLLILFFLLSLAGVFSNRPVFDLSSESGGFMSNKGFGMFLGHWNFLALMSTLWQVSNALIATYYYMNDLRKQYLRFFGWTAIGIVAVLGLLYFVAFIPVAQMQIYAMLVFIFMLPFIGWGSTVIFTVYMIWYYIISAKDTRNALYKVV